MNGGIYCWLNIINGFRYVGSTKDFWHREIVHRSNLRKNKSEPNPYLQNAWNKYGEINFVFEVLEVVLDESDLVKIEQYYIDWLEPEYNTLKVAGKPPSWEGREHSLETKRKIAESKLGKPRDKDTRDKLSKAHMGKVLSAETKEKMSRALEGNTRTKGKRGEWKLSDETKKRMSDSWKLRPPPKAITEETRRKMSDARKGVPKSSEHKRKIGEANRRRKLSAETKEKIRQSLLARNRKGLK